LWLQQAEQEQGKWYNIFPSHQAGWQAVGLLGGQAAVLAGQLPCDIICIADKIRHFPASSSFVLSSC